MTKIPAHVPDKLVWEHNLDTFPMQFDEPHVEVSEAMHQLPEVIWASEGAYRHQPGWVVTRFEQMQAVHMDDVNFTPAQNKDAAGFLGFDLRLLPFESDPPEHTQFRHLLQRYFTPAAVRALEPRIVEASKALIAGFADKGGCDFVSDFSSFLPSNVFLHLMGMPPEQLPQFLRWEEAFMRGTPDEARAATRAIYDYFKEYLVARRRQPSEDLTSVIASAEVNGRPMSEDDAIGMCMLLYIGGLDTVKSSLSWYMRHLARDQELQSQLRAEPALINMAMNELLRAYAVTCNGRRVVSDFEFYGVQMKAGDVIGLPTVLAARDEREYKNPHVIDINRSARHLSLGTGSHLCLGIHLAKLEMRVVLEAFLNTFENIYVPEGAAIPWTSQGVWGIRSLPLSWA